MQFGWIARNSRPDIDRGLHGLGWSDTAQLRQHAIVDARPHSRLPGRADNGIDWWCLSAALALNDNFDQLSFGSDLDRQGTPFVTDIPNEPTAISLKLWSDGRLAMVGNAQDYSTFQRDPLYIAMLDTSTLKVGTLKALRQGITSIPIYAGTNKAGGASYADQDEENGKVLVSYSVHKETLGATEFITTSI